MGLNANQKRAVEYLDGPLLVLAGPGTGKTQLLSEKVAYILKNTDTGAGNILCLTFTESGAKNMRERLKTIIGKDALKVNIGTYHAFGSEILAQYKNYSPDYARRLDAAIDEVTQFKIIRNIQEQLNGNDILRGDAIGDIISVISEAKKYGLDSEMLMRVARQNVEDSKVISEVVSPLLQNIVPRAYRESYENAYRPIYEILCQYSEKSSFIDLGASKDEAPLVERLIGALARDLKAAMIEAESEQKIKPLSSWKDKYFEKDERGNYRLNDRVANLKLMSIATVMKTYQSYLLENGLYDFDDMIHEAVRVLSEDDGFRMTMQERYQFIMLDEFQDTNPAQFAIVKQLTDYEKPLVMAVGDDDQAIYEFQGALSSNLSDFQAHYGAEVIPLTENYRSTQEILDFSRQIINQAPDRFADKVLASHQPAPSSSQIRRFEFAASDAEYGFVAGEIARLVKSGVRQSDIAVISYKTKYFEPLLPYLKAHSEIKIAYEKRDDLFLNEPIHELITLARFIYELANTKRPTVQALEILSYPFFGLPILEVVKLTERARAQKVGVFEALISAENTQIAEVAKFLSDLVAKSYEESLEVMLEYILGARELSGYRSAYLDYYSGKITPEKTQGSAYHFAEKNGHETQPGADGAAAYQAFRLYENLAALLGKIRKHFGEKALKLQDLIEMVDDYEAAKMPLAASSPYRDADEAVQILTAHKAKGLEFGYVFIISADHTAWGKGKGNNNMLALPKNLVHIRHTGTTDGEKLRVLYVALTRAKHTLYITNSLRDFSGKSPERLEYFEEYQDGDKVISPFLPEKQVQLMYESAAPEVVTENLKNWLFKYVMDRPDMRELYRERAAGWRVSASALTTFIDVVYAGPVRFFETYLLCAPNEPETEAIAYGILVHKVFEAVTNRGITDEEAVQFFLSELDKRDLPMEEKRRLRERGPLELSVSLRKFANVLRTGQAEVNFAQDKIIVQGVPITGKIDHITVNDESKEIEIYDFKTGGYHKERWQSHATLYKYMLQLEFYKLLLNHSARYAKYRVRRAHILFVVPDRDGEVHDKVYDFDDGVGDSVRSLVERIYQLVVSLEFMDRPDIFRAPDSTLGLKDIREFVKLLLAEKRAS